MPAPSYNDAAIRPNVVDPAHRAVGRDEPPLAVTHDEIHWGGSLPAALPSRRRHQVARSLRSGNSQTQEWSNQQIDRLANRSEAVGARHVASLIRAVWRRQESRGDMNWEASWRRTSSIKAKYSTLCDMTSTRPKGRPAFLRPEASTSCAVVTSRCSKVKHRPVEPSCWSSLPGKPRSIGIEVMSTPRSARSAKVLPGLACTSWTGSR